MTFFFGRKRLAPAIFTAICALQIAGMSFAKEKSEDDLAVPRSDLQKAADNSQAYRYGWLDTLYDPGRKPLSNVIDTIKALGDSEKELKLFETMTLLKMKASYLTLINVADSNKVWDVNTLAEAGLRIVEVGAFIAGIELPVMAVFGLLHTAYNIPAVNESISSRLFGELLYGPETTYPLQEFTDLSKVNTPYLICQYYNNPKSVLKGAKPTYWNYVSRSAGTDMPEVSYYKDFVVLHGRWIKDLSRPGQVIRFAALEDPVRIMDACVTMLVNQGVLQAPVHISEYGKILPVAGYTRMTATYPMYFYAPMTLEEDKGEIKESAVLLVEASKPTQSQFDKKDALAELLNAMARNRHLATKSFPIVDDLLPLYGNYIDLVNLRNNSKGLTTEQAAKLVINSGVAISALSGTKLPGMPIFNLIYFATKTATPDLGSLDELFYGTYLKGPEFFYDAREFNADKRNVAYIACQYYEHEDDNPKKQPPAYWNWLPTKAKIKSQGSSESNSMMSFESSHQKIPGRWLKNNDDGNIYFATLSDPFRMAAWCAEALKVPGYLSSDFENKTFSKIVVTVGNTRFSHNFPLMPFVFVPIVGGGQVIGRPGEKHEMAIPFIIP